MVDRVAEEVRQAFLSLRLQLDVGEVVGLYFRGEVGHRQVQIYFVDSVVDFFRVRVAVDDVVVVRHLR